jgi:hypothetical protein
MNKPSEKDPEQSWASWERELYLEQVLSVMSKVATISKILINPQEGETKTKTKIKVTECYIDGLRDDLRKIAIDRINQLVRLSRSETALGYNVYPSVATIIDETINDAYFFSAMTLDGISEWILRPQNALSKAH